MAQLDYTAWKRAVDAALIRIIGVDSECLPDYRYMEAYERKVSPEVCAKRVIRGAKGY